MHEVLSERDSRVDAFDLMRARGLLFEGRDSIRLACPGWVPAGGRGDVELGSIRRRVEALTEQRDEIHRESARSTHPPLYLSIIGGRCIESVFARIVFRRPGQRFAEVAHVDTRQHTDPRKAVRKALGKGIEIEVPEAAAKAAKQPRRRRPIAPKPTVKSITYSPPARVHAAPLPYSAGLVRTLFVSGATLAALVHPASAAELLSADVAQLTEQRDERPKHPHTVATTLFATCILQPVGAGVRRAERHMPNAQKRIAPGRAHNRKET